MTGGAGLGGRPENPALLNKGLLHGPVRGEDQDTGAAAAQSVEQIALAPWVQEQVGPGHSAGLPRGELAGEVNAAGENVPGGDGEAGPLVSAPPLEDQKLVSLTAVGPGDGVVGKGRCRHGQDEGEQEPGIDTQSTRKPERGKAAAQAQDAKTRRGVLPVELLFLSHGAILLSGRLRAASQVSFPKRGFYYIDDLEGRFVTLKQKKFKNFLQPLTFHQVEGIWWNNRRVNS